MTKIAGIREHSRRPGSGTKKKRSNHEPAGESLREAIAHGMSIRSNGQVVLGSKRRSIRQYYSVAYANMAKKAKRDNLKKNKEEGVKRIIFNARYTAPHGKKHQARLAKAQAMSEKQDNSKIKQAMSVKPDKGN